MCGINGILVPAGQTFDRERLNRSLFSMRFRGPNDSGVLSFELNGSTLALGHTRLSIIDTSEAGHQPMHSANNAFSIVFNGEIYNYKELRIELVELGHEFATHSDTEVLLAAWQQWGLDCLLKLTGMFAFVVLNRVEGTLTFARDAFGIKPLFYSQTGDGFCFASDVPALLALLPGKPEVNWQRAYDYLVNGDFDSNNQSFFADVLQLSPGHCMQIDLRTGKIQDQKRWWHPQVDMSWKGSYSDAVDRVRTQFLNSVGLHLRSDVPMGAALSGGVDSSAVVCAMRHLEPDADINTFSFITPDYKENEEAWVDRVNAHVGAIPHKVIATPQDLSRDLDDLILAQGEPFGSTSIYAQYCVYRNAHAHGITVTLDGQGADEMLAGYSGYPGERLRSLLETGQFIQAGHFLNNWSKWPGRSIRGGLKALISQVLSESQYERMRNLSGSTIAPAWIKADALAEMGVELHYPRLAPTYTKRGRRVMAELATALSQRGLVSLLRNGDRNSMRFSIESRVPFLTLEMVEMLLSMPEEFLISRQGETKSVFRAAMRGIVPDEVLDRRDKVGFATPEEDWLLSMADTIEDWLNFAVDVPYLDKAAIMAEFRDVRAGRKRFTWQVWRWINFYRWYTHFIAT